MESIDINGLIHIVVLLGGVLGICKMFIGLIANRIDKLEAGQTRFETELANIKNNQVKLETEFKEVKKNQANLETGQAKLETGQAKLETELKNIKELVQAALSQNRKP